LNAIIVSRPPRLPDVHTVRTRTLAGYEAMAMIRKGLVHNVDSHDIQAQTAFVDSSFQTGRLKPPAYDPLFAQPRRFRHNRSWSLA
jgi:hypothetical protein